MEVFDQIRAGVTGDRSQFYKDLAVQLYAANGAGAKVSQGALNQFWLWSMQAGTKAAYECVKAFSETDFTEDLKKIEVRPWCCTGRMTRSFPSAIPRRNRPGLSKRAKQIYYPGAPHGVTATHQEKVKADLLAFLLS